MVNAGGDLQAAINNAQPGDTILLQAGATFTGNFILPNKGGSSYITIRSSEGYLHFMQVFRTGAMYITTVFDSGSGGRFKAVHSRHEHFAVPLPGATSSPEQYYGECETQ